MFVVVLLSQKKWRYRSTPNALYDEQTHGVSSTPPNMFSVLQWGLAASRRQLVVELLSVLTRSSVSARSDILLVA